MDDRPDNGKEPLFVEERLDSWKAIADYLGRTVTTVQRWERQEGLPVHRLGHLKKGSVFASKRELDAWRSTRTQSAAKRTVAADPVLDTRPEPEAPRPGDATRLVPPERRRFGTNAARAVTAGAVILGAIAATSIALTVKGAAPEAPSNLAASSPRPGTVLLTWTDNSSTETRFEVARFGVVAASIEANVTRMEFSGLDAGISYHWDVRACNANRCSAWHGVVGQTPDGSAAVVDRPRLPVSKGGAAEILFASDRHGGPMQIWVMDWTGASPAPLTKSSGNDRAPVWSPDRTKIAFASDRTGYSEIYVMNADGSDQRNLTNRDPPNDSDPAWSPDGTRIAFASSRSRDADVWVMNADGSNVTNLTNSPREDGQPAWSRDGKRIAFISERDGMPELYVMNADGSNQQRLTHDGLGKGAPAWSPDSARITFNSITRNADIYIINADGGRAINLTNHPAFDGYSTWSPDGTRIAFVSNRDGNSEIYSVASDGSYLMNLTSTRSADMDPDWGFPLPIPQTISRQLGLFEQPRLDSSKPQQMPRK